MTFESKLGSAVGQQSNRMSAEDMRALVVLDAVAQNRHITQRGLAEKLGIAVGLTNLYIKRLVRKGFIKCVNVQSNRLLYLITPRGFAQKTRLTYEYMEYSLRLYSQVRTHLRVLLQDLAHSGKRVAIYGCGEAAELAYLSLRDAGLEPAAIFDGGRRGEFLGMTIRSIDEHHLVPYDLLIVATLEPPAALVAQLIASGVPAEHLITLRPIAAAPSPRTGIAARRGTRS